MALHRLQFSAENCSIARTLAIVGEKWALLVMREALYGLRRFDDFAEAIGCGRAVLTARLHTLVEHGLLERSPYREAGERERFEYQVTAKGRELLPALLALMQWGDRWTADPEGPAVSVSHAACAHPVSISLRCSAGHYDLPPSELVFTPGPGAKRISKAKSGNRHTLRK